MKKPNYEFEKRKKEMKRQKKQEEKRLRKLNKDKENAAPESAENTPPVVGQ